jgi:putative endonuclease
MSRRRRDIGAWGEGIAADFLIDKGYEILQRNARTSEGELDIVARQGECIVFVEVKTRTSRAFGNPEESLTAAKQRRLRKAAWAFLQEEDMMEASWRIDVVAIEGSVARGVRRLEHYEFAVGDGEDR